MITKDDHAIFEAWCRDQLPLYESVVCLDGSASDATARVAAEFAGRLIYLRERDFAIPYKTNHGLRRVAHLEIVRRFGNGHWIMCCHPDEFCYHDPGKVANRAAREGFDHVAWLSPHFYPHPDELADWDSRRHLPVSDRFRHYHWDFLGSGLPWVEDRLYRDSPGVAWDDHSHDSVRPHGLVRAAPFRPILQHYKVLDPDPREYVVSGHAAHSRTRWAGLPDRTGLPFPVKSLGDFFVRAVPKYSRCERFSGEFAQEWNMGEQFRPDPVCNEPEAWESTYAQASRLVAGGNSERGAAVLEQLDVDGVPTRLRALARNDLAAMAAARGQFDRAKQGFQAALEIDPTCGPAQTNLAVLCAASVPMPFAPIPTLQAGVGPADRGSGAPVRVAILSLLFNWPSTGGGTVHTAELSRFLALAGYDVRHFYARYDPWGVGKVTAQTPHPAEAITFTEPDWNAESIVRRFREAANSFDPDYAIITDSWNSKPLLAEAVATRRYILRLQALECLCPLNNVRLLVGADGLPRQCPLHQLARPEACAQCVRDRGNSAGSLHRAERRLSGVGTTDYPRRLADMFANAYAVLVVNPLAEAMVSPYTPRVHVVTAGMDPARFQPGPVPTAAERPNGRLRILFAGLAEEWMKGFHVIHAACEQLWRLRQDFELVVTDERPVGMPADGFTRYVGWQSQEKLPDHIRRADMLVMPTVAQEALGRTAVEAMAVGRPVVASRIGGLPFTVADGATGLLFEPGEVDDLSRKLVVLFDDPDLRDQLGRAGRRRFEEFYSWPVIIERHYRPLLKPSGVVSSRTD